MGPVIHELLASLPTRPMRNPDCVTRSAVAPATRRRLAAASGEPSDTELRNFPTESETRSTESPSASRADEDPILTNAFRIVSADWTILRVSGTTSPDTSEKAFPSVLVIRSPASSSTPSADSRVPSLNDLEASLVRPSMNFLPASAPATFTASDLETARATPPARAAPADAPARADPRAEISTGAAAAAIAPPTTGPTDPPAAVAMEFPAPDSPAPNLPMNDLTTGPGSSGTSDLPMIP